MKEHGFHDIEPRTRTDAMWLASFWSEIISDLSVTHPVAIRAAHRQVKADTPPAPELLIETPSRLTAGIEVVAPMAVKVNKLASMAERGEGQEQATAQKYLAPFSALPTNGL